MGKADRAAEVEAIRKKIGEAAATAVDGMREELRTSLLTMKALAREVEQLRKECGIAKAAPAELRSRVTHVGATVDGLGEQLENLGGRLAAVEAWQTTRQALRGSIFVARLIDANAQTFDERTQLVCSRLSWLPWRRRRIQDLSQLLTVFVGLRLALGIALPTERQSAEQPDRPQQVIE